MAQPSGKTVSLREAVYPVLSVLGVFFMWVVMGLNGSQEELNKVMETKAFPDGTPLRTSFSGIPIVDGSLTTLVAFTQLVTDGSDIASWLLAVDLLATLPTPTLLFFMDSVREGRSKWMAYPLLWALAIHGIGGGVILPLYFFFQLRNPPKSRLIYLWDATPLTISLGIGALLPAIGEMTAPLIPRSALRHQLLIAVANVSPLFVSGLHSLVSGVYPIRGIDVRARKVAFVPFVQRALMVVGIFGAIGHLTVLAHPLFTGENLFQQIYIPGSGGSLKANLLLRGAQYFLQWDYLIITISTLLWVHTLIRPLVKLSSFALGIALIAGDLLLGPGALMAAALWWRERKLLDNEEFERQNNRKIQQLKFKKAIAV